LATLHTFDGGDAPGDYHEAALRVERAARRAVALDDSLPEARVAMGSAWVVLRDWAKAEAEFRQAIALDPRALGAHEGLARVYLWTGQPAKQLAAAGVELDIDPFSHSAVREMALALAMNGRCEEALARLLPLKSLSPPAGVAGIIRGQCYAALHMWPEAIAEFRWAMENSSARMALSFLAYACARAGQRDEAERILANLLAGRQQSHGAFGIATVYAGLGDLDEAFAWLHKALAEGSERAYLMGPMFEDLHRDPRFARVRAGLHLQP
jgi:serine/threonine-protein kinase